LVAFIIGEFDYIEDKTKDGVLVRVYTPIGKKESGKFALDLTTKIIPFFNEFFGIDYPLPKMDLIGISDFAAGAMENWGLLIYRENRIYIDEENSTLNVKRLTARVIAHEISHQVNFYFKKVVW
jgi:puromycin-sensitive aminopeptidase